MDDLDALEVATGRPPSSSASSVSASSKCGAVEKRPAPWDLTTPKKKVARRGGSRLFDTSVKDEASDDGHELAAVKIEGLLQNPYEPDDWDKPCFGCDRGRNTDRCFLDLEAVVGWAFTKLRGNWCRDCHTVWRTNFSHEHKLLMFGFWIKVEANFAIFEGHLIAYVSLLFEGNNKITASMITERVNLLRFLSKFLCVPLRPSVVVLLENLTPGDRAAAVNSPEALVTMRSSLGDRLGMWVSACSAAQASVSRPLSAVGVSPLNRRRYLSTTSPDSALEQLKLIFPDRGDVADMTPSVIKQEHISEATPLSKARNRFRALEVLAKDVLVNFENHAWESVTKASSLHHSPR